MGLVIARLLICIALLCIPLVLFIAASRKPENMMWLIIPVFGGIPAILGALLVFVPVERYLAAHDLEHLKNIAVPLAGALLVVIFIVVFQGFTGGLPRTLSRIASDGMRVIWPILFWSVLGVIWGALWRVTDWIAGAMGLSRGA